MVGEPAGLGGTEAGPAPYDYPLTALGSCTAMTVRMYADRKGWPLEAVTVRLGHQRSHAKDRAECETKSGRLDHIELERDLEGPLEPEQRERLREMADQCSVKRTLGAEVPIETSTTAWSTARSLVPGTCRRPPGRGRTRRWKRTLIRRRKGPAPRRTSIRTNGAGTARS